MSLSFIDFSKNESVNSGRVHLLQYYSEIPLPSDGFDGFAVATATANPLKPSDGRGISDYCSTNYRKIPTMLYSMLLED